MEAAYLAGSAVRK